MRAAQKRREAQLLRRVQRKPSLSKSQFGGGGFRGFGGFSGQSRGVPPMGSFASVNGFGRDASRGKKRDASRSKKGTTRGLMDMRDFSRASGKKSRDFSGRGKSRGRGRAAMSDWPDRRDWFRQPIRHKRAAVLGWSRRLGGRRPKNPTFGGHRPVLFHPVGKRRSRDFTNGASKKRGRSMSDWPDRRDWFRQPIRHKRAAVLGWSRRLGGRRPQNPTFGGHRPVLFHPVGKRRGRGRSRDFAVAMDALHGYTASGRSRAPGRGRDALHGYTTSGRSRTPRNRDAVYGYTASGRSRAPRGRIAQDFALDAGGGRRGRRRFTSAGRRGRFGGSFGGGGFRRGRGRSSRDYALDF